MLLRSASGYVAATRATPVSDASRFDRILVLVSSRRPAGRVMSSSPSGVPQPAFQSREPTQDTQFEDQEFGASAPGQPAPTMFEYASPSQLQQLQELLQQPGGELQGPAISPTNPFRPTAASDLPELWGSGDVKTRGRESPAEHTHLRADHCLRSRVCHRARRWHLKSPDPMNPPQRPPGE